MGKCVVKSCNSRSQNDKKTNGITFHTVPKNPVRRKRWVTVIRALRKETDWIPTKFSLICSKHFRDEDIIDHGDDNRIFLSPTAVPVLNPTGSTKETSQQKTIKTVNICDDSDLDDVETDDDIREALDSPEIYGLRKTIERLRALSKQRLQKMKSLACRNKRLIIKNEHLKSIIKEMKKEKGKSGGDGTVVKDKLSLLVDDLLSEDEFVNSALDDT